MSNIIEFPATSQKNSSDLEALIDKELSKVRAKDREKLKFELIKMIDSYDAFFTEWRLTLPAEGEAQLKKELYDIAHIEHQRKMRMLSDIIRLKIKLMVCEYYRN